MKRSSPFGFGLLSSMFIATAGLISGKLWAEGDADVPRGIAAKVNGHVITRNQVAMLLTPTEARLSERFPDRGPEYEKLLGKAREDLLKELTDRMILIDQFNQPKVLIRPEAIEAEVRNEIRDNYQGSEDQFREALKRNRVSWEGFRSLVRDRLIEKELQKRNKK